MVPERTDKAKDAQIASPDKIILVVDTDVGFVQEIRRILPTHYRIRRFDSIEDALACIKETLPHLVIQNLHVRGEPGEITEEFLFSLRHTPVLMTVTYDDAELSMFPKGRFVSKPLITRDPERFTSLVHRCLSG